MRIGRRTRWLVVGLGLALVVGCPAPSLAQTTPAPPASKLLWSKARGFRIPVTLSSKTPGRVRELILHVSDDQGYTWKRAKTTTPDTPEFQMRVSHDGEYWFAVQTQDVDGKLYPSGAKQIEPTLRVIVDSTKPAIRLEPTARRGSEAAVRWEVQDAHLLLKTLVLEYQTEGARDWRQVPLDAADLKLIGVKTWDANTAEAVRVRLSVRDRADNVATAERVLPDGLAANPGPATASPRSANPPQVTPIASRGASTPSVADDPFAEVDPPASSPAAEASAPSRELDRDFDAAPTQAPSSRAGAAAAAGSSPTLLVGGAKFPLRYEVTDAGPDGPALVELWTTRDGGRTWSRQAEDADRRSPYNVDLGGEGTFGLWLVVQSASGLGDPPPAPGERPQSWVEVDSTAPVVAIDRPRVGKGQNAGKVLVTWRAGDTHLAAKPISIFYREDRADAPWVLMADRIDNTGRYLWSAPASVPPKFHVKVEALDTLGNRGASDTQDLGAIVLDRARPRGKIIGLEPGVDTSRR